MILANTFHLYLRPGNELIKAAEICEANGATSITTHLREDRRHIKDDDVKILRKTLTTKMNLEMAATEEILNRKFSCQIEYYIRLRVILNFIEFNSQINFDINYFNKIRS